MKCFNLVKVCLPYFAIRLTDSRCGFCRFLERPAVINDDLPCRILQGAVVLKPNVKEFKVSGVLFEDGTLEANIDAVVFCTGYNKHFEFLPTALSEGPRGELPLYK